MRCARSLAETLEPRIAPASLYFLSPDSLGVVDKNGNSANDTVAQAFANSDIAVRLAKGDKLILDVDGDGTLSPGDSVLLTVRNGAAIVFAKDLNDNTGFGADELTGLVVSDEFQGVLTTGVKGSIITALNPDGSLSTVGDSLLMPQRADITGLSIVGEVTGNIFASGSIKNVKITGAVLGNLATGTEVTDPGDGHTAAAPFWLNGSSSITISGYMPSLGEAGGDITNIRLDVGIKNILSGSGGPGGIGVPGRGGSITHVAITMAGESPVWIHAGEGGISDKGNGARGGSLSDISIKFTVAGTASDVLSLRAGNGGRGGEEGFLGNGGNGGSVTEIVVVTHGSLPAINISAGQGGVAEGRGVGGIGGSILNASIHALGSGTIIDKLSIVSGAGGLSAQGTGGAGGSIANLHLVAQAVVGRSPDTNGFEVRAGSGGAGPVRGGLGGSLTDSDIIIRAQINTLQPAVIQAGSGGSLLLAASLKSVAGKGGAVSGLSVTHQAEISGGLLIAAGDGGSAAAAGRGGAGGAFSGQITGMDGGPNTAVTITAGNGGASTATGIGGAGGNLSKTVVTESGTLKSLTIKAGNGANGGTSGGAGGAGGAIGSTRVLVDQVTGLMAIRAGSGGASTGDMAGAGGAINNLRFQSLGQIPDQAEISAGAGGSTAGGTGGAGGGISNTFITNIGDMAKLTVQAGNGGAAVATGTGGSTASSGNGGAGGTINKVTLRNVGTLVTGTVEAGDGGDGGTTSGTGGAGGKLTLFTARVADSKLLLEAGKGGNANNSRRAGAGGTIDGLSGMVDLVSIIAGTGGTNASGPGGNGGAVRNIDFDVVYQRVQMIVAGNGGNGSTAGSGGSISNVSVAGDIGDFTKDFDVINDTGMGGMVVGQAGSVGGLVAVTKNGSINKVTADRIATMIAGRPQPNGIKASNAVLKITKITTDVLGADVNGDGSIAHNNPGDPNPEYDLNQPLDTLLDGIVLYRANGLGKIPNTTVQFHFRAV